MRKIDIYDTDYDKLEKLTRQMLELNKDEHIHVTDIADMVEEIILCYQESLNS